MTPSGLLGDAAQAAGFSRPGSRDSPPSRANISIDNRMAAPDRYTLPLHNWQVWPRQAGFAGWFIHPVQPVINNRKSAWRRSPRSSADCNTSVFPSHTITRTRMSSGGGGASGGAGALRVSQVFQVQVGTGSPGVSGRIPQPSKAAAAFEPAGPTKRAAARLTGCLRGSRPPGVDD